MDLLGELPWIVSHGALLWRVALAALVVVGAALGALRALSRRAQVGSAAGAGPYRENLPRGSSSAPSVLRGAALGVALGAAAFALIFVAGGELALRVARWAGYRVLRSPGALVQFAAATPHRARALAALEDALTLDAEPTPTTRRRLVAAQILGGRCGLAARSLMRAGQHRRAAELLEGCPHDRGSAAYAWLMIGEFDRAVRAIERDPAHTRGREDVLAYVLADRSEASRVAREAALAERRAGVGRAPPERLFDRPTSLECVADALDARRGDAGARARLGRRADERVDLSCLLLFADLLDGPARLAQLARWPAHPSRHARLRRALACEADPAGESLNLSVLGLHAAMPVDVLPPLFGVAGYVALSNHLVAALEDHRSPSPGVHAARAYAAASVATFEALAGDDRRAQYTAGLALASTEALPEVRGMLHDPTSRARARWLVADVDLRSGHPERVPGFRNCDGAPPTRCVAEYLATRDPSVVPTGGVMYFSPEAQSRALWDTLARGDGAELVARVRTHRSYMLAAFDALLPLTLRHVVRNRAVVLDHVQWHEDALRTPDTWHRPTLEEYAAAARWRARTARALGAPGLAAEGDAAADRLRAAALRRDIAVVRAVLQWPEDYELEGSSPDTAGGAR